MTLCNERSYFVNGAEYPRVSTILSSFFPTSVYLESWRLNNPEKLEDARNKGIKIHENINNYAKHENYDRSCKTTKNLIDNFYQYVQILHSELFLLHDVENLWYAGTTDAVVYIKNDTFFYYLDDYEKVYLPEGVYIVDNKTKKSLPSSQDETVIKTIFQLCAYSIAYTLNTNIDIQGTIALYTTTKTHKYYYCPKLWNQNVLKSKLLNIVSNFHLKIENENPCQFINYLNCFGFTPYEIISNVKKYDF